MKILLVGGGSGGHITPALAVASELRKQHPDSRISYVLGRGDKLRDVVAKHPAVTSVISIHSGKLRRYHGEGWRQLFDVPTLLKNIRDGFLVGVGLVESFVLLKRERPDIIFIKGGFVGVPVGLMAALLKVPFITHDSDAVPGLANRIIARWATAHAVAMPKEAYSYPKAKTYHTGVPITADYVLVTAQKQMQYKRALRLDPKNPVLLVTGGGLGAVRLNNAVVAISKKLLARHPRLHILHIAGPGKADQLKASYKQTLGVKAVQVSVEEFVQNLHCYSGAADVIVARAGATTLAEFATQAKACIIVPNQHLTGGHQLKNAEILAQKGAIVSLQDQMVQKNPEILLQQIEQLLNNPKDRLRLARSLHATSTPDAAADLATLITTINQKIKA